MANPNTNPPDTPAEPAQPGTIITPGGLPRPAEQRFTAPIAAPEPEQPSVLPPLEPTPPPAAEPAQEPTPPPSPYALPPTDTPTEDPQTADGVAWTASEYIAHEKSPQWYLLLTIIALAAALVAYIATHDYVTVAVIVFGAIILGIYAARQPRELSYRLDDRGIQIGSRHFHYGEFRSFAIMEEGAFSSIVLLPLKRFAPMTSMYYAPADEPRILDVLGSNLPNENRSPDMLDRFMRRIRF